MRWTVEPSELDALLPDEPKESDTLRHQLRCDCGRFARWGGDRHYYNGIFDCYSYDVTCARCGTVTVECV